MEELFGENFTFLEEENLVDLEDVVYPDDKIWYLALMHQVLFGIVCLVGLFGNTLVISVVCRFSNMQTVTNCFILNLALADDFFLLGIPVIITTSILGRWAFGNFICKAYYTFTSINQFTSSLFLTVLSGDRFLAICHPIRAMSLRTPKIARNVSLVVWLLSALYVAPIIMYSGTTEFEGNNKTMCGIIWPSKILEVEINGSKIFIVYSFILSFVLPVIFIMIFYYLVLQRLRTLGAVRTRNQTPRVPSSELSCIEGGSFRESRSDSLIVSGRENPHSKVSKMVLTIIVVYFCLWAPYWAFQLYLVFNDPDHSMGILYISLLTGILSYSNSAVNPILYAFLSENFKASFKKAFPTSLKKVLISSDDTTKTTSLQPPIELT